MLASRDNYVTWEVYRNALRTSKTDRHNDSRYIFFNNVKLITSFIQESEINFSLKLYKNPYFV